VLLEDQYLQEQKQKQSNIMMINLSTLVCMLRVDPVQVEIIFLTYHRSVIEVMQMSEELRSEVWSDLNNNNLVTSIMMNLSLRF